MGYTVMNIINKSIEIELKRKNILIKSLSKTILKEIYKNQRS